MSAKLWIIGSEGRLNEHIRHQDEMFQAAMRAELIRREQERHPKRIGTVPPRTRRAAKVRTRDIIAIPSFINLPPPAPWQRIVAEVCAKHEVSKAELTGEGRAVRVVLARQEAMYRMRHETTMSSPAIARRLGRADHTTVLYGVKKHKERMAQQ